MLTATLTTNVRYVASQIVRINRFVVTGRRSLSSKTVGEESLALREDDEDAEEALAREAAIEKKRNKSALYPDDYNRQHGKPPNIDPLFEFQHTLRYRRRLYGKYGEMSNVDPSILWPSKEELSAMKEYEGILQPLTIHELIKKVKDEKEVEARERADAEAGILKKVAGIDSEIAAFNKRKAVEDQKIQAAISKRNKLIEQVRQHFGYKIDVKDARFKAMMVELELQDKKEAKAAKKAKKKAKLEAYFSSIQDKEKSEEGNEEDEEKGDKEKEN